MTIAVNPEATGTRTSRIPLSVALIIVSVIAACILMALPLSLPVGPMYWDVIIYYDAANRIFDGQVPVNDFFAPVGPLGYYLFAGWLAVFPDAQPTLIAHWSLLAVTAPLMAIALWQVEPRSRATALSLVIPFLIFALLPFNTREFYPFPGSDGFGIYNRQCCQIIYILVAALLFVRNQRALGVVILGVMLSLFFLKITGFVAAAIICFYAFLAGRVAISTALATTAGFLAVITGIEAWNELVSHYVADILSLVAKNDDTILPRFLQSASLTFGVVAPAGALILLLVFADREAFAAGIRTAFATRRPRVFARLLDHDALWLGVVVFAGIFYETQNTGSQAMIFVWPVVLSILLGTGAVMGKPRVLIAVLTLCAAAMLPVAVNTVERAARTYIGGARNIPLAHENLKSLGALTMRDTVLDRANDMIAFYAGHQKEFEDLVAVGELPSPVLYSDFDFQVVHLMATDRAISSIRKLERDKGVRFDTIMSLNFVNPFPWLMDRSAPKHIAIGADPTRAVPRPGPAVTEAVEAADLVLYPLCPLTTANANLYAIYEPMLAKHRRVHLDDCYDAFVHPRFGEALDR